MWSIEGVLHRRRRKLRSQAGFALPEILVSMTVLLAATLGSLSIVGSSNGSLSQTRAREGATNLARELLEGAHSVTYSQVGEPDWFRTTLESTDGQSGFIVTGSGNSMQTAISRRGVSYTVTVTPCSVDDPADGYGTHPAGGHAFCADSSTTDSQDSQAEDFKRVTASISWSYRQRSQPTLNQTATFAANGAAIGPSVTNLTITSPPGLSSPPVITSPSTTTVTFLGTSVGANDMKFSVDGSEQTTGVTNNGNGTWTFNWDISQLTDGLYTIGAIAVDALGNRGPSRTIQVKLARGVPVTPQNVTGGYNNVYVSGTKTQVVELAWDANPEGNVTGYDVLKGSTTVCSASLAVSCIDFSAAASGSTTYTVRTVYNDASGNPGSVSATYNVSAPVAIAPALVGNVGQATCGSTSNAVTVPAAGVAAGNTVIVRATIRGSGAGAVSATDTRGNTYTNDKDVTGSNSMRVVVLSAHVGTALQSGDVITVTHPSGSATAVVASAYSGIASSSRVDTTGSGGANSNSPSASVTTTNADDLIYGAVGNQNSRTVTEPASWNTDSHVTSDCGGAPGNSTNNGAYRVVSSTGSYTYNPTLSNSEHWGEAVVAYKSAGATTLSQAGTPTGLTVTANGDGTRTLTWTAPTGTPAVEFYRVYRDGYDYTNRIDTSGATGSSVTWTDTNTGGSSHTYRVTSATSTLTESAFAGPVTG
jgi:Big-like domain-containing protein